MTVVGWTDCYFGYCMVTKFTEERKIALIERIRKRKYNFNYADHCYLPFGSPVYDDLMSCELTKQQWDEVMNEAYKDIPLGQRLMPQDVIDDIPVDGVLYEKKKFYMKGDNNNG